MGVNEKVDFYINELLHYKNMISRKQETKLCKYEIVIRKILKELIENNYEYLLTSAFLYHIVKLGTDDPSDEYSFDKTLYNDLSSLINQDRAMVALGPFIDSCRDKTTLYFIRLNNYENSICTVFDKELKRAKGVTLSQYFFLEDIFQIIAAYILYNKRSASELKLYTEPFINDWETKLDEMCLQLNITREIYYGSYNYDFVTLAQYIIRQLDNEKKEIR